MALQTLKNCRLHIVSNFVTKTKHRHLVKATTFTPNLNILLHNSSRFLCIADRCPNNEFRMRTLDDKYRESVGVVDEGDTFGSLKVSLEIKSKREKKATKKLDTKTQWKLEEENILKKVRLEVRSKLDEQDAFGNLSNEASMYYSDAVEETVPDDDSTSTYLLDKEYRTPEAYLKKMKSLVKEKKLKEALELFPRMKENNVIPIYATFTFMIGACGRAGYTEMAFKLLRQMTDQGFRPSPATLTGLFNACAESPFPEYGLKKATFLKEKVAMKNWQLTQPTYHAMIKAFGRCGDIQTAFEIVDEMTEAQIKISNSTYNFLLIACISNKEAGFTHAIEVWRKMMSKRQNPDIFTFNLLLRAVRDCGVGPKEVACLLLQHWSNYIKSPYGLNQTENQALNETLKLPNREFDSIDDNPIALLEASNKSLRIGLNEGFNQNTEYAFDLTTGDNENRIAENMMIALNLLSRRPLSGHNIADILNVTKCNERLALLGNADGFLATMKNQKVQPDIKTLTLLLENIAPNAKAEDHLLSLMEQYKVQPDTDFFNILIKRKNMRNEYESAKKILHLIFKKNLSPDVVTFGVLALGCYNKSQGLQLLWDMKNSGFHPNVEILGAMISEAKKFLDFHYMKILLCALERENIKPNEKILKKVENLVEETRKNILLMEQGKKVLESFHSENFLNQFKIFCDFYSDWLQRVEVEVDAHPWQQYQHTKIKQVHTSKN